MIKVIARGRICSEADSHFARADGCRPLCVSLAYVYAAKERNLQMAAIAALSCVFLGALALRKISCLSEKIKT